MTSILFAIAFLFLGTACTPSFDPDREVRIGQFGSFSGPEATFGQATDRGVKLAVEARNAAGGVKGRRVVLLTEDNQGKAEEAVSLVKKLIAQHAVGLIGEVASTRSLAAGTIAEKFHVPMISPSSTNPDVTKDRDFVFGTTFVDPVQGPTLARFAAKDLGLKRVAVLRDTKSDYSVGLSKYFGETFTKLGGKIVVVVDYSSNDPEFKGQLTKIRALKPDGIFVPGYYNDLGPITRQAKDLGMNAKWIGGDGWGNPKLLELAHGAAEGAYFSNFYSSGNPSDVAKRYVSDYRAKYGIESDPLAAAGFDTANILMMAMERAKDLEPASIRDEIAKTKNHVGATGTISFNANGNAEKEVFIVQIRGSEYKLIKMVTK